MRKVMTYWSNSLLQYDNGASVWNTDHERVMTLYIRLEACFCECAGGKEELTPARYHLDQSQLATSYYNNANDTLLSFRYRRYHWKHEIYTNNIKKTQTIHVY